MSALHRLQAAVAEHPDEVPKLLSRLTHSNAIDPEYARDNKLTTHRGVTINPKDDQCFTNKEQIDRYFKLMNSVA